MFKCGVGINSKDNMANGRGRIIMNTKENYIDKSLSSTRFHQRKIGLIILERKRMLMIDEPCKERNL